MIIINILFWTFNIHYYCKINTYVDVSFFTFFSLFRFFQFPCFFHPTNYIIMIGILYLIKNKLIILIGLLH